MKENREDKLEEKMPMKNGKWMFKLESFISTEDLPLIPSKMR